MAISIEAILPDDLPFSPGTGEGLTIAIRSQPEPEAVADGERDPFDWMDLRHVPSQFALLMDAEEIVVEAAEAALALTYPLENCAVRMICPADGRAFTRGELVRLIDETYREIYRMEEASQSAPTPPVQERQGIINRPTSDGTFGIWGHDLNDLGIEQIEIFQIDGRLWIHPEMAS